MVNHPSISQHTSSSLIRCLASDLARLLAFAFSASRVAASARSTCSAVAVKAGEINPYFSRLSLDGDGGCIWRDWEWSAQFDDVVIGRQETSFFIC
jgi:hypothetical protein